MSTLRRIQVLVGGDGKHQRKFIVSMDAGSSIDQLMEEISSFIHEAKETLKLEVEGGFELRGKEPIDIIRDEEVVRVTPRDPALSSTPAKTEPKELDRSYLAHPDEPTRLQIRIVTAENARAFAKENPKQQLEPTNGVLAFDGEFVSGNVTFGVLQEEVARVCGWDIPTCSEDHDLSHEREAACSCSVAQQIEQNGLFSRFHCRFSINGTRCKHDDCLYSHVEVNLPNPDAPPHCVVCLDALGFPCPKCIEQANASGTLFEEVVHCPLIQNAGCGHLHHAHCVGARSETSAAGCPSGCPQDKFPREDVIFDSPKRHLVIVWDSDRIDHIPIPDGYPEDGPIQISTREVINLVEEFLKSTGRTFSGLSLKIHSRDAVTESVRFSRSTLVSVCSQSEHTHQSYRRFDLSSPKPRVQPIISTGDFYVDLHTSTSPIIVCRCTPLKDIFLPTEDDTGVNSSLHITLYAVRRKNDVNTNLQASNSANRSKERVYLVDSAWQPSVLQTRRGMAALLSSLYTLVHAANQKGTNGESNILAFLYAITRFPPAVRTLAVLLRNSIPLPQERAALSTALYHACGDFVLQAPPSIARDPSRSFEAIRILLAHVLASADQPSPKSSSILPMIDSVSFVCSVSRKRLTDPILMDSVIVEKSFALLHQSKGSLYQSSNAALPHIADMEESSFKVLRQLLCHLQGTNSASSLALHVERIGPPPQSHPYHLESVARDFTLAIQRANKTDLATRGPLDLKSSSVVPPQIVVDEDGLLAVFTGRGCGSIRDVNFFRPTNNGDTEVDINDVAHALEKIIPGRRIEDTWQVDSYTEDSVVANRPPDEAIVLCLDLSESMNEMSGIHDSRAPALREKSFDADTESLKVVEEMIKESSPAETLAKAEAYLSKQHASCHYAWKDYLKGSSVSYSWSIRPTIKGLLEDLGLMARRDVLKLSMEDSLISHQKEQLNELAFFAAATVHQLPSLEESLRTLLDNLSLSKIVGTAPYDTPRHLLDPKTGDLLTQPVRLSNSPYPTLYVNADSQSWFEARSRFPSGPFEPPRMTLKGLKKAVDEWVSGADLLPKKRPRSLKTSDDNIIIMFTHVGSGNGTIWHLTTATTTRVLYSLVHRATQGRYSSFTIRLANTKATITDSTTLTLGTTDLVNGGAIEISRTEAHVRSAYEVHVEHDSEKDLVFLLPRGASILSVISYIKASTTDDISEILLWYGLQSTGDGKRRGTIVSSHSSLMDYTRWNPSDAISFECDGWTWHPPHARKVVEESRSLSRLHLLKELFNIFLNRASSFDSSVSLALGLVTFSGQVREEQQITPVFESFRRQLDHVSASGDTALYDALDTARSMLCKYYPEMPSLRKRIIVVSDGVDTCSKSSANEVCHAIQKNRILVDSVQVGKLSDKTLHAISVATGGYRFAPQTSLSDALSIFDLETMLSSAERPPQPAKPLVDSHFQLLRYSDKRDHPIDVVTVDQFPPRIAHAKIHGRVRPASSLLGEKPREDENTKRIMRELQALIVDPHPQIDLYVNESDITFFKLVMEAPKDGCPYKGGTFLLSCNLPQSYPRDPPEVRFVTFILHPNVSKQGKVSSS
ncbi:hypothetical protein CPB86DRAFT_315970 [Serendipita vermifera]|nr:hypothetical protein CPB86DRAFT_315970 [Serendipita vermifera]